MSGWMQTRRLCRILSFLPPTMGEEVMSEYLKSNMQPGVVDSVAPFSNLIVENWTSLLLPEITV